MNYHTLIDIALIIASISIVLILRLKSNASKKLK